MLRENILKIIKLIWSQQRSLVTTETLKDNKAETTRTK